MKELIEKLRNVIDENEKNVDFAIATETVRVYLDEMEQVLSQSEGEKERAIEEALAKYWYDTEYNYIDKSNHKKAEESRLRFRKWIDENLTPPQN